MLSSCVKCAQQQIQYDSNTVERAKAVVEDAVLGGFLGVFHVNPLAKSKYSDEPGTSDIVDAHHPIASLGD
jgi:hypothetical protein